MKKEEFYEELMYQQLSPIFIEFIINFCNSYRHVGAITWLSTDKVTHQQCFFVLSKALTSKFIHV